MSINPIGGNLSPATLPDPKNWPNPKQLTGNALTIVQGHLDTVTDWSQLAFNTAVAFLNTIAGQIFSIPVTPAVYESPSLLQPLESTAPVRPTLSEVTISEIADPDQPVISDVTINDVDSPEFVEEKPTFNYPKLLP